MAANLNKVIMRIQKEYSKSNSPWFLGFSGGKDSSALLKLVFIALKKLKKRDKTITIIYCDTGIEIPIVRKFVYKALRKISIEVLKNKIPIKIEIVKPKLQDTFFVNIIGKGYPPPTNKFRWCTDRLRTKPINSIFKRSHNKQSVILLGTRRGESHERDRTLKKYQIHSSQYFRQANNKNVKILCPVINFKVEDVWNVLLKNSYLKNIDFRELAHLYSIKDMDNLSEVKKNRFGCWVCTVVRKDRAMESMIKSGYPELKPLLQFRNWLIKIRDIPVYRCNRRRNGKIGLGPLTLKARKLILNRLLITQQKAAFPLISERELSLIRGMWREEKSGRILGTS
jgi:DNA sulfur modification protein DndC